MLPFLLPPPRTSEFWYEDEDEFDAIAGSLRRKQVFVFGCDEGDEASSSLLLQTTAARLSAVAFDACFYGCAAGENEELAIAAPLAALWPAERSGPPYFLKPRRRPALDELAAVSSSSSTSSENAADSAWKELASQNWRVELGYGLGGGVGGEIPDPERPETLLVVVASRAAAAALLSAAASSESKFNGSSALSNEEPYAVVTFRAWEGGREDEVAPSWRDLVE